MKNRALGVLCLLVVFGILAAGLWPFNPFPRNEVSWAPGGQGLRFGDYGTILSAGSFAPPIGASTSCALEIWLTPGLTDDSNVILAFSVPENLTKFRVGQSGSSLTLAREVRRNGTVLEQPYIAIDRVFQQGRPVLLTVTAGPQGTSVYLDGVLAKVSTGFGLNLNDFSGAMVVANSPVGNNSWSGLLRGIALYDADLRPQEVLQHYQQWSSGSNATGAYALYLFREGSGGLVHNLGSGRWPDLYIPDHYLILHPTFLQPLREGFYWGLAFWKDFAENVMAFIPLGFLLNAFFSRTQRKEGAFWISTVMGVLLSLTIELLQYFLPMRDSDTIDFVTNSLGTIVGACFYSLESRHAWLRRLPGIGRIWARIATYPGLEAMSTTVPRKTPCS